MRLGYYVSKGFDPYAHTVPIQGLSIPGTGVLPSIGYPPLWAFFQAAVYDLYSVIGFDNRFFYYFLIKQETILPDIVVSLLIFRLILDYGKPKDAEAALTFWMFCPFVILISALWGMFDQLVLVFVLVALLTLQTSFRSSVSEAFGILLKGIPIIFLPGLSWSQKSNQRKVAYTLFGISVAGVASLAPYLFFREWSVSALLATGADAINRATSTVNYWAIAYVVSGYITLPIPISQFLGLAGYFWVVAVLAAYVYCFKGVQEERITFQYLILVLQFVTLVFFLTRININEQYVLYFVGLGLIERSLVGTVRSRLFAGVWVSATGFLVVNNAYLTRFLAPLGLQFTEMSDSLSSGALGIVRSGLLVVTALTFTLFCALYLKSVYADLRRQRSSVIERQIISSSVEASL